jgi:hypothetical protein
MFLQILILTGSKMMKVDMPSEAITRLLRQVDQLRELSLSLMKAKKVSDEKAEKLKQQGAKETKRES